jgi:hypothetical protein
MCFISCCIFVMCYMTCFAPLFLLFLILFLSDPFYFSMSSKAASSVLDKGVSSCAIVPVVLHMDAMYFPLL